MNDTIAAISTAFGEGAIAIVRLSGPRAVAMADAVFVGKTAPSQAQARVQQFGSLSDQGRKLDDVLLSVHRAPHSYTGDDVVEINCHGGILISRSILELFVRAGARVAQPGEFTQRAYLAGKMDLTQAEAVMDLISAQTELALRAATEQLEGRLGERVRTLRDGLIEVLAHVEAYIDFPEEDIDPQTGQALLSKLVTVEAAAQALLATAGQGRILREGVRTVIYGAPNVGKSSLLNLLLGCERAIVSARPGTTRDVIEEVINLRGLALRLVDTAGIRESDDEIEREGMERTQVQVLRADLVLHLVDASAPMPADFEKLSHTAGGAGCAAGPGGVGSAGAAVLLLLNKADLGEHPTWRGIEGNRISCLKGAGIEPLETAIFSRITDGQAAQRDWSVAINARHKGCLERTLQFTEAARGAMSRGLSPEFVAEDLRSALQGVGEMIGGVDVEDILGKIFSTFCIGK